MLTWSLFVSLQTWFIGSHSSLSVPSVNITVLSDTAMLLPHTNSQLLIIERPYCDKMKVYRGDWATFNVRDILFVL